MSFSTERPEPYTTREGRPRHLRLRSEWARWGTRQAKAAQAVGDQQSAALFLQLIAGLADVTATEVRQQRTR